MAVKLYGSVDSDGTQRVQACLHEKEVEFEFIPINTATGEHKTPRFLAQNPFGEVPVLEDGEVTLFESRAITQYIANKYDGNGTDLTTNDPIKLAILTVWMDSENQRFDPPFSKILEASVHGKHGVEDMRLYERKLEIVLDVYEQRLTQSKYLAGDSFTLVDLHHQPGMHYLRSTKAKGWFQGRPHVRAWAADILSRPSWVKVAALCPW